MEFREWLLSESYKPTMTAEECLEYAQSLHWREDDFWEGDLTERIEKFLVYILTEIPISQLDLDEWQTDEDSIEEMMELTRKNPDYPPIIYDPREKSIIDGTHRANALDRLGYKTIKAYVGKWGNKR